MATVNLGAIRFNWKGAYNNGTAYVADDVVSSAGSSYICILASTGNAVSNATYWSQMSSAGTDLSTTITTQGDVLYRDGSGLQRLAKGTASQSLTMNSGATAPEWTTPAAGGAWNIITSTNVTSAVASVDFTTGIDATYRTYIVQWEGVVATTNTRTLNVALGDSSGFDTASADYSTCGRYNYGASAGSAQGGDSDYLLLHGLRSGTASGSNISGQITFTRPTDGVSFPHMRYNVGSYDHTPQAAEGSGVAVRKAAITVDRIRFIFESSSTIARGRFTLYGISHA